MGSLPLPNWHMSPHLSTVPLRDGTEQREEKEEKGKHPKYYVNYEQQVYLIKLWERLPHSSWSMEELKKVTAEYHLKFTEAFPVLVWTHLFSYWIYSGFISLVE